MSGLLDAIGLGAVLSVLAGGLAWLLVRRFQASFSGSELQVWRAARWVALLPLLLAPAIYAVPQYEPVLTSTDAGLFVDLPPGDDLPFIDATQSAGPILPSIPPSVILLALYLTGLAVALGLAFYRHVWRARILRDSRDATTSERAALEAHARSLGVVSPELRISDQIASPFITGWRSVVVAPPALFQDARTLRFALVHELTHLKRGDERDRLVGSALMALLWFNWPLRWIEHNLNQARELACDAECLQALGGAERKSYAAALIDMMRSAAQPVSAFGPDDRRHREMRIKAILAGPRRSASPLARLVLIAGAAILPVACAQAALTERTSIAQPVEALAQFGQVDPRLHNREVASFGPDVHVDPNLNLPFGPDVEVDPAVNMRFGPEVDGTAPSADVPRRQRVLMDDDGNIIADDPTVRPAPPADLAETLRVEPRIAPVAEPMPSVQARVEPAPVAMVEPRIAAVVAPAVAAEVDARVTAAPAVVQDVNVSLETRIDHPLAHNIAISVPDFTHRVTDGRVTSHFGHRPQRPAGSGIRHRGTDIAAPTGTPIWAAGAGTVVHAEMGYAGSDRWGYTVVIDHGNGWKTFYAHMHKIDVEVGDTIRAGHPIGQVGSTGASTGPHVHVELRHGREHLDPANFLPGLR